MKSEDDNNLSQINDIMTCITVRNEYITELNFINCYNKSVLIKLNLALYQEQNKSNSYEILQVKFYSWLPYTRLVTQNLKTSSILIKLYQNENYFSLILSKFKSILIKLFILLKTFLIKNTPDSPGKQQCNNEKFSKKYK